MGSRVEDNENVTYSCSCNNGEGEAFTQPQGIPSHETLIIHTTHSVILGWGGRRRKRRKKIKNLTNYRQKFLTDILAIFPLTFRSKLYSP